MSLSAAETQALADLQALAPGPLQRVETPPEPGERLSSTLAYCVEDGAVTALAIRFAGLTGLPTSIGNLAHLRQLDLSGNALAGLPDSLGRLARLHALYLDSNRLGVLPGWLRQREESGCAVYT